VEGRVRSLAGQPLADAFHRRAAGAGGGSDLLVGRPLVGPEQDPEVPASPAVQRLALQSIGEFGARLGSQSNEGRLAQEASPVRLEEMSVYDPRPHPS
jgi:hypothetical protein